MDPVSSQYVFVKLTHVRKRTLGLPKLNSEKYVVCHICNMIMANKRKNCNCIVCVRSCNGYRPSNIILFKMHRLGLHYTRRYKLCVYIWMGASILQPYKEAWVNDVNYMEFPQRHGVIACTWIHIFSWKKISTKYLQSNCQLSSSDFTLLYLFFLFARLFHWTSRFIDCRRKAFDAIIVCVSQRRR